MKDKHNNLLSSDSKQEMRLAEHLKEVGLLNRPPPMQEAMIENTGTDLVINTELPNQQEIILAINSLKNRKAPGEDNLNTELFKADPRLAAEILQPLFSARGEISRGGEWQTRG